MLRMFATDGGHSFMHLPVDEAVRWLDGVTSGEVERLVAFAENALAEDAYRDAAAAALRVLELGAKGESRRRAEEALAEVDKAAAAEARKLEKAVAHNANGDWVDGFWEFRRQFAFAPVAGTVMASYQKLRDEHEPPAEKAFWAVRRESDDDVRKRKYLEIVDEYYPSSFYKMIKRWYE
ncbi:MAG: hypothetical protein GY711_27750 [bacterium]|nr:hypothetical protein [bacterium]